jgi:hypothetical protein
MRSMSKWTVQPTNVDAGCQEIEFEDEERREECGHGGGDGWRGEAV